MNAISDLDVCRGIRRVMVKHWIDMGRLSVRSTRGRVIVYGTLQRLEGCRSELIGRNVTDMAREMKRVQGVRQIKLHLENWLEEGGAWRRAVTDRGQGASQTISYRPDTLPPDNAE